MPTFPATGPVTLRTNLADSPTAAALKSGAVSSPLVNFEFAGTKVANEGFKPMVREGKFQAGELAIVTYLQAKAYGKPLALLPATMVGRFQHHMLVTSSVRGPVEPKDLEGQKVAVRAYSQTTGVWVRGLLQHEYGVDLNKVTWLCRDDSHVAEAPDPANVERLAPGAKSLENLVLDGDVIAGILGNELPKDPAGAAFFRKLSGAGARVVRQIPYRAYQSPVRRPCRSAERASRRRQGDLPSAAGQQGGGAAQATSMSFPSACRPCGARSNSSSTMRSSRSCCRASSRSMNCSTTRRGRWAAEINGG